MTSTSWKTKNWVEDLQKKIENSKVLKKVIDNLNTEAAKNKIEIISANKALKAKDKKIYKLEKSDNQNETLYSQKGEIKKLKDELKMAEKEINKI